MLSGGFGAYFGVEVGSETISEPGGVFIAVNQRVMSLLLGLGPYFYAEHFVCDHFLFAGDFEDGYTITFFFKKKIANQFFNNINYLSYNYR